VPDYACLKDRIQRAERRVMLRVDHPVLPLPDILRLWLRILRLRARLIAPIGRNNPSLPQQHSLWPGNKKPL
jgi:hypothetical protein